ncbi:general stress protein [Glycomyces algeriensis]|uniref:General stress protein 17M-like domain-containing protein n=1 Tax=Glycomyces algeriensis TaxID=256037 RepID=A0A9W6G395_9ACTN|nr:general stress protein [Glycomyces algeriensis]MDA1368720.1 hypothetical protein [Glycomyces algeriensis]MDR7352507.1 hypothetical protein [Glycomyces algeriensis]GLI40190.1 hypothetical protein GALLR39Z86_00400 [Glycomyces algeriensis]
MSRAKDGNTEGFAGAGQVLVGSYADYAAAERAVDHLSDAGFPVERTAIVGRGLSSVERVTGRLTIWRAAGQGAVTGAVLGAVLGWLFGMFNWIDPLIAGLLLAFYGVLFGALAGAVMGLVAHALTGGRRDFSSVSELRADSYDLLVDAPTATDAGRLLDADDGPGRSDAAATRREAPVRDTDRNTPGTQREHVNDDRPEYERAEAERSVEERADAERRRV